jgi:4-diphosphocytidyl-2-C-methyl-D-erythritol kinase
VAKITSREEYLQLLITQANDLESAAVAVEPVIAEVLVALRALTGCRLARMSGSGATCFALFSSAAVAIEAAKALSGKYPQWWVRPSALGGG